MNTLSPAHVADDEQLAVCACHPHHFHDDGTLGPEAVDLAYTCGMSVSRLGSDCDEQSAAYFCEVNFTGVSRYAKPGKPSKPGKKAVGIAVFTAGDARRVVHTDKSRAYSVFDTAREDQPEHADVVATKYFGARENLPVDDQAIRLAAQLELLEKMEVKFTPPYTKEMLIKDLL
ncbi:hypothetical protein L6227_25225 [Pseudomonas syringae pv. syringae]|uniref:hypothetical protein n=1 Tax=Pseudomonas syringae TaxID=317 RepID=UPI001F0D53F4|nr:hypothetical protein [Pseudomonas syringae]MCH5552553.1 hypothetical protein [Pseudomonas syringae pv. syringae]